MPRGELWWRWLLTRTRCLGCGRCAVGMTGRQKPGLGGSCRRRLHCWSVCVQAIVYVQMSVTSKLRVNEVSPSSEPPCMWAAGGASLPTPFLSLPHPRRRWWVPRTFDKEMSGVEMLFQQEGSQQAPLPQNSSETDTLDHGCHYTTQGNPSRGHVAGVNSALETKHTCTPEPRPRLPLEVLGHLLGRLSPVAELPQPGEEQADGAPGSWRGLTGEGLCQGLQRRGRLLLNTTCVLLSAHWLPGMPA